MERRIWIKHVLIAGGGILLLPACKTDNGAILAGLKNILITDNEEKLFEEVCETIIPATDTPGAKALNLHQFVLKMMDDCYDKTQQEKIIAGLRQLDNYSEKSIGKDFIKSGEAERIKVLGEIPSGKSKDENLKYFLAETRRWTIKGYETSQYVMTKLVPYEMIPGRFHGCVKITKTT